MDGVAITANQWNQLKQLNVSNVRLIYLLGLSVSKWPNNCYIDCYCYDSDDDIS